MITIVAKKLIKQEKIEEFKSLAKELIDESRKENGNVSYNLYQDVNNSKVLTFIEEWENQDAINIHNNSKHFTSIVPKLGEFGEGDTQVNLYKKI